MFKYFTTKAPIGRQVARQARSYTVATKRVSNSYAVPTAGAIVGAIGFYAFSTQSNVKSESKRSLTGDGEWVDFKVKETKDLSHNTKAIIFDLPKENTLGLETASCVLTKFTKDNGKNVIRPYTPTSDPEETGEFELVVKSYPDGAMSQHIHSLKPGDTLAFKGPILKYKITPNKHKEIGLIGGGTGITPLYQVLHEIAKRPEDKTKVTLIYASQSPSDILLKKELDALVAKKPDQFKIHYFVDKADSSWKGETGFISKEFLEKNLFPAKADNVEVFVCGPPGLMNAISGNKKSPSDQGELTGALKDLGFTKEQVFKF